MRTTLPALLLLVCVSFTYAQPVPRMQLDNPLAGFSITVPEDWTMATGRAGNVEIAIDAPTGATLALQPALWFFYAPKPPAQEAQTLARDLTLLGGGAKAVATATGRANEWEVRMQSSGVRGPLIERWLCRLEGDRSYVIGAFGRPGNYEQFQGDLDTALQSCHLIALAPRTFFREPSENAYRMSLPVGWKWEGQIYRDMATPGYFVWKVQSPQGATGAFSSPPAAFNIAVPYTPAGQTARLMVLPHLRQEMPDIRLEGVHELPRAGATAMAMIRGAGLGKNPRVNVVLADYVGTYRGNAVRLRATLVTWMLDQSALLGGRGNWFLNASGAWGPINDFDQQYALGRAVVASVRTDPRWRANQRNVTEGVINDRNDAIEKWGIEWDELIREY